jgi:hypothetical protein
MLLKGLARQVSKFVKCDACPRPATHRGPVVGVGDLAVDDVGVAECLLDLNAQQPLRAVLASAAERPLLLSHHRTCHTILIVR